MKLYGLALTLIMGCSHAAVDRCRPSSGNAPVDICGNDPSHAASSDLKGLDVGKNDKQYVTEIKEAVIINRLKQFERLCISLERYSKIIISGEAAKQIKSGLSDCYWVFEAK